MKTIIKIAAATIGVGAVGFVGFLLGAAGMYEIIKEALLKDAEITEKTRARILQKLKNNEFDGMTFDEVVAAIQEEITFEQIAAKFDK